MLTQAICNSYKLELHTAIHDFSADTFKLALFRAAADIAGIFGASTTNYSEMGADEASGTGYTATGITLTGAVAELLGSVLAIDFDDAVLPGVTITTRGALLYNGSKDGRALAVFDFGTDKHFIAGTFRARMPVASATTALLRAR